MKNVIQSVRGTRDFYPEQMAIRQWLYGLIADVSSSFGYEEYDGPFIEKIDLYAAKSGEELVKEQAFVFTDRGGDLVTLRPELTPSLARMIAAKQNELIYPLRLWSFGPFWRYEKPQKGRTREFFQWNIDLIGVDSPEADAELVSICAAFLKKIGITPDQIAIKVNHRQFIEEKLAAVGIPITFKKKIFQLIDRIDKLSRLEWAAYGREIGLNEEQLNALSALLADTEIWRESKELTRIFSFVEALGLGEYVKYDPRIVRGLDYYTGTVFEASDVSGDGRAVLGGGHYDNLVADVGGSPLAGVGFAMGDVMISILLEKYGILPKISTLKNCALVTLFDETTVSQSAAIANRLREEQLNIIFYPEVTKLQKQIRFADRKGIRFVVLVGPDEIAGDCATLKDLVMHTQVTVPQELVGSTIKALLAGG